MTLKSYFSVINVLLYKLLFSQLGLSLEVLEIVCELSGYNIRGLSYKGRTWLTTS